MILLALHVLSVLPSAYAWTSVWRNASDNAFVEHDQQAMSCKQINNAQGELFEWDSEDRPFAISLYASTDCSGSPGGYATHIFNENASKPILSFKVDSTATTTTSASSTSTTSTSSPATSSTTQTPTAPIPTASPSSSPSSGNALSGGANWRASVFHGSIKAPKNDSSYRLKHGLHRPLVQVSIVIHFTYLVRFWIDCSGSTEAATSSCCTRFKYGSCSGG